MLEQLFFYIYLVGIGYAYKHVVDVWFTVPSKWVRFNYLVLPFLWPLVIILIVLGYVWYLFTFTRKE